VRSGGHQGFNPALRAPAPPARPREYLSPADDQSRARLLGAVGLPQRLDQFGYLEIIDDVEAADDQWQVRSVQTVLSISGTSQGTAGDAE